MKFVSLLRLIWAVLRLVVVPLALVWLFSRALSGLRLPVDPNPAFVAIALALNQIALMLFGVRMWLLLRTFDVRLRWIDAFRIHLQSMFYFVIVPMTVGLEVARFAKVRSVARQAPTSLILSGLLFDRFVGAGSAAVLAVLAWPFVPFESVPWAKTSSTALWLGAAGIAAIAGALCFPVVRRVALEVFREIRQRWRKVALVFCGSMFMHVTFALGILFAAWTFGISVNLFEVIFAVAAGMLLVAIPISLAGVGAADVATTTVFMAMGHSMQEAIVFGTLPYVARLVGALEGGVWEMLEGGTQSMTSTRALIRSGKTQVEVAALGGSE